LPEDLDELDFESFVQFAERRVTELAPGIDAGAMAFVLSLHRAASTIVYDLESSVHRPAGWSWAGFKLLFALWIGGPEPVAAKTAARLSGNSRQATSTLANTLEREGLLRRVPDPHDGRGMAFALTPAGLESISRVYAEHNRRETVWASVLTEEERTAVARALEKVLAAAPRLDVRRRLG
jgi:DNA-binding MarR family transcriptional regulator